MVRMKRKNTLKTVQHLSVFIVSSSLVKLNYLSSLFEDLPGASELVIEDGSELVKNSNALLACLLEDFGKPEAIEYRWTKSVFLCRLVSLHLLRPGMVKYLRNPHQC